MAEVDHGAPVRGMRLQFRAVIILYRLAPIELTNLSWHKIIEIGDSH